MVEKILPSANDTNPFKISKQQRSRMLHLKALNQTFEKESPHKLITFI